MFAQDRHVNFFILMYLSMFFMKFPFVVRSVCGRILKFVCYCCCVESGLFLGGVLFAVSLKCGFIITLCVYMSFHLLRTRVEKLFWLLPNISLHSSKGYCSVLFGLW